MEKSASENWKARSNKILKYLLIWAIAYVLSMALATLGSEFLWEESNKWLTIAAILLNLGIGIGMVVANIRHLDTLDEMMRKIQLEAMAISLGAGVIGGLSYSLLDTENLIPFDAEIGHLILLIGVTYLITTIIGCKKYL